MITLQKGTFCVVPIKNLYGLNPYQQVIYMWLCHHSNQEGICWPSLNKLSEETGIKLTALKHHLIKLEELGLLEKNQRKTTIGDYDTNIYKIIIKQQDNEVGGSPNDGGGSPNDPPVGRLTTDGVGRQTTTNYNHINKLKPRELKPYSCAFEKFWEIYPIKKSKIIASESFNKINPDEELLSQMIKAVELQRQEMQLKKENGRFVPEWKNPATWLNQRCWEDEVDLTIKPNEVNNATIDRTKTTGGRLSEDLAKAYADAKAAGFIP